MAAEVEVQSGEGGRSGGRLHLSPLMDSNNKNRLDMSPMNQSSFISPEPSKPVPSPKPRLTPKPFTVDRNPTIKPILAPKPQPKPRPESTRTTVYKPELPNNPKPQTPPTTTKLASSNSMRPTSTTYKISKLNTGQTNKPVAQPFKPAPPFTGDPSKPISPKPSDLTSSRSLKRPPSAEWSGSTKMEERDLALPNKVGTSITRAKSMGHLLQIGQDEKGKTKSEAAVTLRAQPRGIRQRPVSAIFPTSPTKPDAPNSAFPRAERRPLSADLTSKFESVGLSLHRKTSRENENPDESLQKKEQEKKTTLQNTNATTAKSDQSKDNVLSKDSEDTRGASIKSRISLLLDSSSLVPPVTGQAPETPTPPAPEAEPAVGVKQRIKQLTVDQTTPTQSPVLKPVLKPRPLPLDLTKRFSPDPAVSLNDTTDRHDTGKAPQKRGEDPTRTPSDEKTFVDLRDFQDPMKTPVSEGPDLILSPNESEALTVRASVFENVIEKHNVLVVDENKEEKTILDQTDEEGKLVTATYKEPVSPSGPVRIVHAFDTVPAAEGSTAISENIASALWEDKAMTLRSRRSEGTKPTPDKTSSEQTSTAPRYLRVGALPKWALDEDIDMETGMPKDKPRDFEVEDASAAAAKRLKTQQTEEQAKPRATYFALTGQMQETVTAPLDTAENMPFSDPSAHWSSQGKILPFKRNPSLVKAFGNASESNEDDTASKSIIETQREKQKQLEMDRQTELEYSRLKERDMQRDYERQRQKAFEKEKQEFEEKQRALEIHKQFELERQKHLEFEKQRQLELKRQKQLDMERQKQLEVDRESHDELERQKQIEVERQRQAELEKRRQLELDRQRQIELEKQRQLELKKQELERQKQLELETQRHMESQRRRQLEAEKQRQKKQELERQRQMEQDRQRQIEIESQKKIELEKQRQMELERQKQIEAERHKQKEIERQREFELEMQRQIELERQKLQEIEREKRMELEKERQRQLEKERRELEKQRQLEEERRQNELDRERKLMEMQKERQRMQAEAEELERRRQLELQKQRERQQVLELEKQRLREKMEKEQAEKHRQMALEHEMLRLREVEKERERQKELEREMEREKQREQELQRQRELDGRRQKQLDMERQELENQKIRQQEQEKERQRREELERLELEKQKIRQQEQEKEWQRREELERMKRLDMERLELEKQKIRQQEQEKEWQRREELERMKQLDMERQELEKQKIRQQEQEKEWQRREELERMKQLDMERQELEKQKIRQQEQEKERQRREELERIKELERKQLQEFENQKQAERQQIAEQEIHRLKEKMQMEKAERMRQVARQQEAERQRLKEKQKKDEQERIRLESSALRPKVVDLDSVLRNEPSLRGDPSTRWKEPFPKSEQNLRPDILDINSFTTPSQPSPTRDLFPVVGFQEVNPRVPMSQQYTGGLHSPVCTTAPQNPWELNSVEMSVDKPEQPKKHFGKTSLEQLLLRQGERRQTPQRRWSALVVDDPFRMGAETKPATPTAVVSSSSPSEQVWLPRDTPTGQSRADGPSQRKTQGSTERNRIRSRSMSRRSAPSSSAVESSLSRMRSRSAHRDQDQDGLVQQKQNTSTEDESNDAETPVHETDSQYGTWETGLRSEDSLTPATPSSESNLSPSPTKPQTPPHLESDATDGVPASPELPPFPEASVTLLDNSAQRSRAQLGKKRAPRTRPSRVAKPPQAEGGAPDDWLFKDTTEEKLESKKEDSDSEEQPKGPDAGPAAAASSQPQRVALFPGMDQSALMAQLKKRGEADNSTDGSSPSQLSRSPKSPFLPRAARVLPPAGGKENGEEDSPQWLKELKSKKRLSQYETES
ncbi:uncharacterized protein [Eucyclogobius newberryi]|uniref:uncharacterized protein n=1 Tax=Eucyclogobius newberryi TaxID=166745 RepID=UPI003B5A5CBB